MSQYTTGQIAKECGVSVRTVQYYDHRGILVPSSLSDGGRRLYTQEDLGKMQLICYLRSLGISIDSIGSLLTEEHPEKVIRLLLAEQETRLRTELAEKQDQLAQLVGLQKTLTIIPISSPEAIQDAALLMNNRKKLWNLRLTMLSLGFVMDAIEVSTLMIWILRGIWWPFCLGMAIAVGMGIAISWLYFSRTVFLCPECHNIFRPLLRDSFFARHTPYARKLRCPRCGHHGFCVETYGKDDPHA